MGGSGAGPAIAAGILGRAKGWVKRVGPLAASLRTVRGLVRPESEADLTRCGGVTWRILRIDGQERRVHLEAYDQGGIYDTRLNAEGITYSAQVPGNYYADAYSAYAFAWLYRRTGEEIYLQAARIALSFVRRVYPSYFPAGIVWHHSDFKNPAFLEAVEVLLAPEGLLAAEELRASRELVARFREDWYAPTNVFALRFHWYAARSALGAGPDPDRDREAIERCLDRLEGDQTAEGMFHDNIAAYPDAHDLTYHQYTQACLAQGLSWVDHSRARDLFLRGALFSLGLTTPDGEVAYVGRGANNVYHSASAILAFEAAARLMALSDPAVAGSCRRAARLLSERLGHYQLPDGSLPTAMNDLVDRRVGWNHCATPYNALSAAMLLKASQVAPADLPEAPLPMDRPDYLEIMDDSGYAAVRTDGLYAVIFGGCSRSYAWSEGKHRTGVAGLAQLGIPGRGPLLPILDHPTAPRARPLTDLPIVNGEAPYGRGVLERIEAPWPAILYRRTYGRCRLERIYLFPGRMVLVVTRVQPEAPGDRLEIQGLIALPVRRDRGWSVRWRQGRRLIARGPDVCVTASVLHVDPAATLRPRIGKAYTNPRGLACRVDLAGVRMKAAALPLWACHRIDVGADGHEAVAPAVCRREADRLVLEVGGVVFHVDLDRRTEAGSESRWDR